jgi:2C-methyl-D-erythritol 2,4-cyclodiphosphate synthase
MRDLNQRESDALNKALRNSVNVVGKSKGVKTMTKITEIIPDDLPEWAVEAMAEGQFFRTALQKIQERDRRIEELEFFISKTNNKLKAIEKHLEASLK